MKKTLALLLALTMIVTCCGVFAEGFAPAESYDIGERTYYAGNVTLEKASQGGGTISTDVYAGIEGKDYTDEKVYTYNDFTAAIGSSMNWDPLSWETNEDSDILDYVTTGFYTFNLNSDKSGYSITPELAADYPVDVTAEYAGSYGVQEGETAKAWRIALNRDATWDNGEKITADDYVYSLQQLLNPKMLNRRADSYYAGTFIIHNAKNYLYAGAAAYNPYTGAEAVESLYVDMWNFWGLQGAPDANGNECPQYVSVLDDNMYRDAAVEDENADEAFVSGKYLWDTYLAAGMPYESYATSYVYYLQATDAATWDEVGFKKIDDYTVDFILDNPVDEPAFYVPYNLSSSYLVYKPLYESCKSFFNADGAPVETEEEAATVTTNYCRTLDTSISYGPYKLTAFELDKEYTMSRNDQWFGYRDGKHLGQYQTDVIKVTVIAEHATAMLAFEKGEIDGISLQSEDMDKYGTSEYIKYGPNNGYTTKLTFNTDYQKLLSHGTNSQVLMVDEFRAAFANCFDRKEFANAYTAAGTAGFGLLNEVYCYDPFSGGLYRDSEGAKAAMCAVYDVTWGEGGDYETVDEAYAALTGYNMEHAQELMKVAYDKAVSSGIYDGESPVTIDFRVYQSDEIYVKMFTYINEHLQEACKGSGFEGKVSLTMTVDADYYETNYSGGADMIFTTWGGASMSPFTLLYECYCDASDGSGQQMEYGYDTTKINVTFNADGTEITDTLQNWAKWADNSPVPSLEEKLGMFADYSYATRCTFFAGAEAAFLYWHTTTPVYYRNSASLDSQKISSAAENYVNLVGFGGIQFITYNYDDAEWADYIVNNTLQY